MWEVKVASGRRRPHRFYVTANGGKVVRRTGAGGGDDARRVLRAKVTLATALRIADRRVGGRLDEAEIDRNRGRIVWEVNFDQASDTEVKVVVNAGSDSVINVRTDGD